MALIKQCENQRAIKVLINNVLLLTYQCVIFTLYLYGSHLYKYPLLVGSLLLFALNLPSLLAKWFWHFEQHNNNNYKAHEKVRIRVIKRILYVIFCVLLQTTTTTTITIFI